MPAAVIGLGLIGGSAALALRARAYDRNPRVRSRARELGIRVTETAADAVRGAELVLVAVPTSENPAVLREVARLAPSALLTDIASIKRPWLGAESDLPERVHYVSGHPMAGSVIPGLDGARADLFAGRPWLIVPRRHSKAADVEHLSDVVRRIGAIPIRVDAEHHDELMAWASHLPLVVAAALARAVDEGAGARVGGLAGPGLIDTTRLADTPLPLALELSLADPPFLADAIEKVVAELHIVAEALRAGDSDRVRAFFEEASQARKRIRLGPSEENL
jgi:prephenate dehydrogenase